MKQNQIAINESRLIISTGKVPVFIMFILTMILSILALIPLLVTFLALNFGEGLHLGIGFSFILCWGIGFYLLRVTLWNSVGRETLTIDAENISYVADYGLFKDGRREIQRKDLETEIIYDDQVNKLFGRLRLKNKSTCIESVIQVTTIELEKVKKEINNALLSSRQP